jgi:hypothetical protein
MLGPLFSEVEVAREGLNRMLDAAKIRVCPVVYMLEEKAGKGHISVSVEIILVFTHVL